MSITGSTTPATRSSSPGDGLPVRVLVVDDEPSLAELLSSVLRFEGWDVRTAADGVSAVRAAREFRPDAVVLDVMLPDFDGLEVLRRLRQEQPRVCVLFLTARDAVEDRVAGITAGGDDYVTKPFSIEEVLARRRGLLRRADLTREHSENELAVADLTMDEDAREVRRGGELIELTATEFELLRFMMRNPRRVLSKAQILDRVWNYDFGGQAHVVELYNPGLVQGPQRVLVPRHRAAPERHVDPAFPGRGGTLAVQRRNRHRGRQRVQRHVADRGHPAGGRRTGGGGEPLPLGPARLVDVHVRVDQPG